MSKIQNSGLDQYGNWQSANLYVTGGERVKINVSKEYFISKLLLVTSRHVTVACVSYESEVLLYFYTVLFDMFVGAEIMSKTICFNGIVCCFCCFVVVKWNFPFFLAIVKLAPATAAGCTLILKPAEQTPLTAIYLGSLVKEVQVI